MKILMFTWEYPPRIVGGISRVVEGLSRSLTELGQEVHVITNEMPGFPAEDNDRGVFVHRVAIQSPTPNFHTWVMMMNHYFSKRAGRLVREIGDFDISHIHDWLVLPAGAETKSYLGTTLVSTLHSLEFRRSGGVDTPESKMVDSLEWWITYESSIIILCSKSMKDDTISHFRVPQDKLRVIPIGIDQSRFRGKNPDRGKTRAKYGVRSEEKLVLFVGRLTSQKGCEYLIRAIPYVTKFFNVKLLIAGDGYLRGELEAIAVSAGVRARTIFAGFVGDDDLTDLFLSSDLMMIPSVYEPFGVVALEAMAARLPVVASNVDGLAEIIKHEENGILAFPRDSSSIAWGISRILSDQPNTQRLVENASRDVESKFSWSAVAKQTLEVYKEAKLSA
jgi:glycosyltransferase involved in cell wall biosynthesis